MKTIHEIWRRTHAKSSQSEPIYARSSQICQDQWNEYNWNAVANRKLEAKHESQFKSFHAYEDRARSIRQH